MFTKFCEKVVNENLFDKTSTIKSSNPKYIKMEDYLPILSALFFRFASEEMLSSFVKKYDEEMKKYRISLTDDYGENEISLRSFLGNGEYFFVYDIIKIDTDIEKDYSAIFDGVSEFDKEATSISELYEHFPNHFFVPVKIEIYRYKSEYCIIYECKIRQKITIIPWTLTNRVGSLIVFT